MIELEIQCPHCKALRKWISYNIKKREEVFGKQATCWRCSKHFVIRGNQEDRIVREIRFSPRKRVF